MFILCVCFFICLNSVFSSIEVQSEGLEYSNTSQFKKIYNKYYGASIPDERQIEYLNHKIVLEKIAEKKTIDFLKKIINCYSIIFLKQILLLEMV